MGRNLGYAIARSYAGRAARRWATTATYVSAGIREVVIALAAFTGEPYPLALPESNPPG
jgi:hypothetical protein